MRSFRGHDETGAQLVSQGLPSQRRWHRQNAYREASRITNFFVATPLKTPERQRVVFGREGDFETDPRLSGDLKFGGSDFLSIERCAQTAHRVAVAHRERLRDRHFE